METNTRIKWNDVVVTNMEPMDGEEIVREIYGQTGIEITRQNISNALKCSMGSFFHKLSESDSSLSPFQVSVAMLEMLYLPKGEFRGGIHAFFKLFPVNIRELIENDAKTNYMRDKKAQSKYSSSVVLCKNCFHCKSNKPKGVYCTKGHFSDKQNHEIDLYMPYDFECTSFDEMY